VARRVTVERLAYLAIIGLACVMAGAVLVYPGIAAETRLGVLSGIGAGLLIVARAARRAGNGDG
jgi:hypothetical protein